MRERFFFLTQGTAPVLINYRAYYCGVKVHIAHLKLLHRGVPIAFRTDANEL